MNFTFFTDWIWAFFALALIVGARPAWKALYGEKSVTGDSVAENIVKKKSVAKKSRRKKK